MGIHKKHMEDFDALFKEIVRKEEELGQAYIEFYESNIDTHEDEEYIQGTLRNIRKSD